MANIALELQQIMSAIYGEEVRGSIRNAIDKINKVGEKTLNSGNDIVAGDSAGAYYENSLYINTDNKDLLRCDGTTWIKIGSFKGEKGVGIASVTGPTTVGLFDTYVINFDDGSTTNFTITNGKDGNKWYRGSVIDGKNPNPTKFINSGIAYAYVGDCYLNTSEGAIYHCETAGDPNTALWSFDFTMAGGGSGTTNYNDLDNKPTINDITMDGNKTGAQLNLATCRQATDSTFNSVVAASNEDDFIVNEDHNTLYQKRNGSAELISGGGGSSFITSVNTSQFNVPSSGSDSGKLSLADQITSKLDNFNDDGSIATGSNLENVLEEKADSDDVYTKTDIDNKVPFTLAIDDSDPSNPVYGYIKAGADTVTPFKTGGTLVREYLGEYSSGGSINIAQRFPDLDLTNITSDNFSIMPARTVSTSGSNGPDYYGGMNRLRAVCSATYNVPSISYNSSNHTVSWSVGSLAASGRAETDSATKTCSGTNSNPACYIYFYHN